MSVEGLFSTTAVIKHSITISTITQYCQASAEH